MLGNFMVFLFIESNELLILYHYDANYIRANIILNHNMKNYVYTYSHVLPIILTKVFNTQFKK